MVKVFSFQDYLYFELGTEKNKIIKILEKTVKILFREKFMTQNTNNGIEKKN